MSGDKQRYVLQVLRLREASLPTGSRPVVRVSIPSVAFLSDPGLSQGKNVYAWNAEFPLTLSSCPCEAVHGAELAHAYSSPAGLSDVDIVNDHTSEALTSSAYTALLYANPEQAASVAVYSHAHASEQSYVGSVSVGVHDRSGLQWLPLYRQERCTGQVLVLWYCPLPSHAPAEPAALEKRFFMSSAEKASLKHAASLRGYLEAVCAALRGGDDEALRLLEADGAKLLALLDSFREESMRCLFVLRLRRGAGEVAVLRPESLQLLVDLCQAVLRQASNKHDYALCQALLDAAADYYAAVRAGHTLQQDARAARQAASRPMQPVVAVAGPAPLTTDADADSDGPTRRQVDTPSPSSSAAPASPPLSRASSRPGAGCRHESAFTHLKQHGIYAAFEYWERLFVEAFNRARANPYLIYHLHRADAREARRPGKDKEGKPAKEKAGKDAPKEASEAPVRGFSVSADPAGGQRLTVVGGGADQYTSGDPGLARCSFYQHFLTLRTHARKQLFQAGAGAPLVEDAPAPAPRSPSHAPLPADPTNNTFLSEHPAPSLTQALRYRLALHVQALRELFVVQQGLHEAPLEDRVAVAVLRALLAGVLVCGYDVAAAARFITRLIAVCHVPTAITDRLASFWQPHLALIYRYLPDLADAKVLSRLGCWLECVSPCGTRYFYDEVHGVVLYRPPEGWAHQGHLQALLRRGPSIIGETLHAEPPTAASYLPPDAATPPAPESPAAAPLAKPRLPRAATLGASGRIPGVMAAIRSFNTLDLASPTHAPRALDGESAQVVSGSASDDDGQRLSRGHASEPAELPDGCPSLRLAPLVLHPSQASAPATDSSVDAPLLGTGLHAHPDTDTDATTPSARAPAALLSRSASPHAVTAEDYLLDDDCDDFDADDGLSRSRSRSRAHTRGASDDDDDDDEPQVITFHSARPAAALAPSPLLHAALPVVGVPPPPAMPPPDDDDDDVPPSPAGRTRSPAMHARSIDPAPAPAPAPASAASPAPRAGAPLVLHDQPLDSLHLDLPAARPPAASVDPWGAQTLSLRARTRSTAMTDRERELYQSAANTDAAAEAASPSRAAFASPASPSTASASTLASPAVPADGPAPAPSLPAFTPRTADSPASAATAASRPATRARITTTPPLARGEVEVLRLEDVHCLDLPSGAFTLETYEHALQQAVAAPAAAAPAAAAFTSKLAVPDAVALLARLKEHLRAPVCAGSLLLTNYRVLFCPYEAAAFTPVRLPADDAPAPDAAQCEAKQTDADVPPAPAPAPAPSPLSALRDVFASIPLACVHRLEVVDAQDSRPKHALQPLLGAAASLPDLKPFHHARAMANTHTQVRGNTPTNAGSSTAASRGAPASASPRAPSSPSLAAFLPSPEVAFPFASSEVLCHVRCKDQRQVTFSMFAAPGQRQSPAKRWRTFKNAFRQLCYPAFSASAFSSQAAHAQISQLAKELKKVNAKSLPQLLSFAYSHRNMVVGDDGWGWYRPEVEFYRQGALDSGKWQLSFVNQRFEFSPTYPAVLAVPVPPAAAAPASPSVAAAAKQMPSSPTASVGLLASQAASQNALLHDTLSRSKQYRSKGRVPALTYYHRHSGAAILRSAQPLPGLTRKTSAGDEQLCRWAQVRYIFDARPRANASANALKGGGFELKSEDAYQASLVFCDIENIHVMRASLKKVTSLCRDMCAHALLQHHGLAAAAHAETMSRRAAALVGNMVLHVKPGPEPAGGSVSGASRSTVVTADLSYLCHDVYSGFVHNSDYLALVAGSQWLRHVGLTLHAAAQLAHCVHNGASVLVHCSDGWDRTSQLVLIAQLLLDPYYRTTAGFAVLVEKDFCSFGHKFADRCGHMSPDYHSSERSPIFVQAMDCVAQLLRQFPTAFEFNSGFLGHLVTQVYACRYGTFLFNSEREREVAKVRQFTSSLWTDVLRRPEFANPQYRKLPSVIWPSADPRDVVLWDFYHRWDTSKVF